MRSRPQISTLSKHQNEIIKHCLFSSDLGRAVYNGKSETVSQHWYRCAIRSGDTKLDPQSVRINFLISFWAPLFTRNNANAPPQHLNEQLECGNTLCCSNAGASTAALVVFCGERFRYLHVVWCIFIRMKDKLACKNLLIISRRTKIIPRDCGRGTHYVVRKMFLRKGQESITFLVYGNHRCSITNSLEVSL